jgi:Domain of unknown function (DUF4160)
MPTVATVLGMWIMFFYDDHEPAHFHVRAADFKGKMALDDLSMIEVSGRMRAKDFQRLRAWAATNRAALWENWLRARQRRPLVKIGS